MLSIQNTPSTCQLIVLITARHTQIRELCFVEHCIILLYCIIAILSKCAEPPCWVNNWNFVGCSPGLQRFPGLDLKIHQDTCMPLWPSSIRHIWVNNPKTPVQVNSMVGFSFQQNFPEVRPQKEKNLIIAPFIPHGVMRISHVGGSDSAVGWHYIFAEEEGTMSRVN